MEGLFEGIPTTADTPGSVQVGAKRMAVDEPQGHAGSSSVLNTTIKLALATALRARVIASVVYRVFNVPFAEPLIQEMVKATRKFSEVQKALREQKGMSPESIREQLGIPCIHAFMAMAAFVAAGSTVGGQLSVSIAAWKAEASKMNRPLWAFLNQQVKLFKLEKMYSSERKKLVVKIEGFSRTDPPVDQLSPKEFWELYIMPKLLAVPTTKELIGVAPAGELERVLQSHLDNGK